MKTILIIIFFYSIFVIQVAQSNIHWDLNNSLNAFVTDGCTMFIDVAGTAWAELIYKGVRLGHYSPATNKTHWSWGWTTNRPKIPLESSEKIYIIEEIRRLPFDKDFLETFIMRNFNNYYVEI